MYSYRVSSFGESMPNHTIDDPWEYDHEALWGRKKASPHDRWRFELNYFVEIAFELKATLKLPESHVVTLAIRLTLLCAKNNK